MNDTAASRPSGQTRAAASRPPWAFGAASLAVLALAFALDDPVDAALQLPSQNPARAFARWLTVWGDWWVAGLAGLALATILFLLRKSRHAQSVLIVTGAGLFTGLTATVLRSVIGRARPNAAVAQGFYGPWHAGHWIIGKYEFASFPSGHAATLIGLTVAAWAFSRPAGILIGVFAALVSWSRVAQSSHHLSDIVASAILALWLAPCLTRMLQTAAERPAKHCDP
jgi:undecaprenyl-diphosphatase